MLCHKDLHSAVFLNFGGGNPLRHPFLSYQLYCTSPPWDVSIIDNSSARFSGAAPAFSPFHAGEYRRVLAKRRKTRYNSPKKAPCRPPGKAPAGGYLKRRACGSAGAGGGRGHSLGTSPAPRGAWRCLRPVPLPYSMPAAPSASPAGRRFTICPARLLSERKPTPWLKSLPLFCPPTL